jgi:hypothetical protein
MYLCIYVFMLQNIQAYFTTRDRSINMTLCIYEINLNPETVKVWGYAFMHFGDIKNSFH